MFSFSDKKLFARVFTCVLIGSLLIVLAANKNVDAQEAPGTVDVETKIDRLEAKIGEVFTLSFSAVYDSSVRITAPEIGKTLDTFEVQSALFSEEITLEDGMKARGGEIKLWALDTGKFTIPAIEIPYIKSDSSQKTAATSAYTVNVVSNLDLVDDSAAPALSALREPLENPLFLKRSLTDRWQFWAGLGAILLAVALLVWRYFMRKEETLVREDTRPAWEKAFERLAGLRNSPHLANAEHKAFYSELTNILKEFMGRTTSLPALDMTTSELVQAADGQVTLKPQRDEIKRVLATADLVKFAKMAPPQEGPERDFEITYTLVQTVRDREIERLRQEEERKRLAAQKDSESASKENELDPSSLPAGGIQSISVEAEPTGKASGVKNV